MPEDFKPAPLSFEAETQDVDPNEGKFEIFVPSAGRDCFLNYVNPENGIRANWMQVNVAGDKQWIQCDKYIFVDEHIYHVLLEAGLTA